MLLMVQQKRLLREAYLQLSSQNNVCFSINWEKTSICFGVSTFRKSLNKLQTSTFPKINLLRKCKCAWLKCLHIAHSGWKPTLLFSFASDFAKFLEKVTSPHLIKNIYWVLLLCAPQFSWAGCHRPELSWVGMWEARWKRGQLPREPHPWRGNVKGTQKSDLALQLLLDYWIDFSLFSHPRNFYKSV